MAYVQNITDIDDPLLERAARDHDDWVVLGMRETALFREDMEALRVVPPRHYIGAVEAMGEIAELVGKLLAEGAAYRVDDPQYPDVYFDSAVTGHFGYESRYDATSAFPDQILDFESGLDKIDLTRIDADLFAGGDQAFHWIGSNAFTSSGAASAGELRAWEHEGSWFVEGDLDGNGAADIVIQLTTPVAPPVQGDFLL